MGSPNHSQNILRPFAHFTTKSLAEEFVKYADPLWGTYRNDQDQLYQILKEVQFRGREVKKTFIKVTYKKLGSGSITMTIMIRFFGRMLNYH
jgi:hypothetical protein